MSDAVRPVLVQNTGNPVLDSTVNLLLAQLVRPGASGTTGPTPLADLESLHERVLKLAQKEPNGLRPKRDAV